MRVTECSQIKPDDDIQDFCIGKNETTCGSKLTSLLYFQKKAI